MTGSVVKGGAVEDSVAAFIDKVKRAPLPRKAEAGRGRLIFAMDATMSRQPSWDRALQLQGEMFLEAGKIGSLDVQLVYFRGFNECRASKWVQNPEQLAKLMTTVDCRGGNTQIGRVLKHVQKELAAGSVNAVIYMGDACEENVDHLCQLAGEIGLLGTPLFVFQEGSDAAARQAFVEMARLTRGAHVQLDASSAARLRELLAAVAVYATGGARALEDYARKSSSARTLLEKLG
jgi:hypothetical protein